MHVRHEQWAIFEVKDQVTTS